MRTKQILSVEETIAEFVKSESVSEFGIELKLRMAGSGGKGRRESMVFGLVLFSLHLLCLFTNQDKINYLLYILKSFDYVYHSGLVAKMLSVMLNHLQNIA